MPNHVHGIIILVDEPEMRCGIPEIVRGFKTFSARNVNERGDRRGGSVAITSTSFVTRKR